MTLFQLLERETRARGIDFLIIGAHAINQYGHSHSSAMGLLNSTKKWPARAAEIEAAIAAFRPQPAEFELPAAPEFNSEPPHLDPVAMYWRCEELVRQGARPRTAEGITAEFVM